MSDQTKTESFRASTGSKFDPVAIANQFEAVLNQAAQEGWEYNTVNDVSVEIASGCLGSLFGQGTSYSTYDVITFQRGEAISHIISNEIKPDIEHKEVVAPRYILSEKSEPEEKDSVTRIHRKSSKINSIKVQENPNKFDKWLKYAGITITTIALIFIANNYLAKEQTSSIQETVTVVSKEALIAQFKSLYKEKSYDEANDILIKIEEKSPNSNFAQSARKALDKKLFPGNDEKPPN